MLTVDVNGHSYKLPKRKSKKVAAIKKLLVEVALSGSAEAKYELVDVLDRIDGLYAMLNDNGERKLGSVQ